MLDQEARERIVSIVDLLDHFGHRIELQKEKLWVCSEWLAGESQVVRLVELLEVRLAALENQMDETETKTLTNQLKVESNRQYVDQHFHQMNETLTNLACRMNIVEEI